ncbi:general stress protein [uncultured Jatrophihabitans sp.]|uniref:general stress protein n=1 Tax=uncultured Jatrophihabitans sp. TaxID=1610747 RepID=UPI0035CA8CBB
MTMQREGTGIELEYPMSLATYDDYPSAQKTVDLLADEDFPVQHVEIVGTDLRSIERVTGRVTRRKVAIAGALSGLWLGVFIGIAFAVIDHKSGSGVLLTMPLLGVAFGLLWSQLGYSTVTRRGTRDFSSRTEIVATRYEVLVEHNLVARARSLMSAAPAAAL